MQWCRQRLSSRRDEITNLFKTTLCCMKENVFRLKWSSMANTKELTQWVDRIAKAGKSRRGRCESSHLKCTQPTRTTIDTGHHPGWRPLHRAPAQEWRPFHWAPPRMATFFVLEGIPESRNPMLATRLLLMARNGCDWHILMHKGIRNRDKHL